MVDGSPIQRAAVYAELAHGRAIRMRRLEASQARNPRLKHLYGDAAEIHERAAAVQEQAVSYLLVRPPHPLVREPRARAA
jgi:hypothetical protein